MHMRSATPLPRRARDEHGFAMVIALMALVVGTLLAAAAFTAVTENTAQTRTYISQQKASFAALAGVDAYKYELSANPNYWTTCPEKAPVKVAGASEETYSYKTLPATGHEKCESGKDLSIIEGADSASGTFRIESTGTVSGTCRKNEKGETEKNGQFCARKIVATFTHPGYLNYVYVSNFEEADPETLGKVASECEYYHKEREEKGLGGKCTSFPWIPADKIEGPFHTNDAADISGSPVFGQKGHNYPIEMNQGYYGGTPKFEGNGYTEEGATLLPPEAPATELLNEAGYKYEGRTIIKLNKTTMEVTNKGETKKNLAFPSNGIVSVVNTAKGCPIKYTPFETNYTGDTECGDVYIKGEYTQSLTVIAQNDVIIIGNLTTEGGEAGGEPKGAAVLGLIAIQHARLYHPIKECEVFGKKVACSINESTCNTTYAKAGEKPAEEFGEALHNPDIDAAILSTHHSWGVDNFSCPTSGGELGTITIWGAVAENWRGRVTCCLSGGDYIKNYKYDTRLASDEPPSFLAPSSTNGWKVERETAPPEP
jgi:Tfp pilus assembly protein PilX